MDPARATIKHCRSGRCRWQSSMLKCRSRCADPAAAAPCSARSSPRRGPSSAAREAGVRRPLDLAPPRRPGGLPRLLLSLTTARFAAQAAAVHLICPSRKSASSVRAAAGRRWERRSTDLEINCTDTTVIASTTLRRSTTRHATTPRTTPSPPRRRHTRPTLNVTRTEDPLLLPLIYSISRTSNSYAFSSDLRS